jgi:hypothetical protein
MVQDDQKPLARTPAERMRAMRQRKRNAGLMPVDLPRDVALRIRELGFDAWLEEVCVEAVRSAEKVGAQVQIEKGRGEMTRQEKTALRIGRAVMSAEGWRKVAIEKLLP